MSRWIDAEWLCDELGDTNMDIYTDEVKKYIASAPTIKTKQIKYYDEDENVWKVGSVIVDE